MNKVNLNSLRQLKPNKSHWNSSKTITIRIPEIFKDEILNFAKKLDNKEIVKNQNESTVTVAIKEIEVKIDLKEKGYKTNSASQLIKDIKKLVKEI